MTRSFWLVRRAQLKTHNPIARQELRNVLLVIIINLTFFVVAPGWVAIWGGQVALPPTVLPTGQMRHRTSEVVFLANFRTL